jgi:transcriptional regulator with XRE-family HTH domain
VLSTQAQLGERLAVRGSVTRRQSSVAALEAGRRRVGVDDLIALGDALDVPPQVLLATPPERGTKIRAGRRVVRADGWDDLWRVSDEDRARLLPAGDLSREMKRVFDEEDRLGRDALQKRERALARRTSTPGRPSFRTGTACCASASPECRWRRCCILKAGSLTSLATRRRPGGWSEPGWRAT